VKAEEIDYVFFSHAHWYASSGIELIEGTTADQSLTFSPMPRVTLAPGHSNIVRLVTCQIQRLDGTDEFLIPKLHVRMLLNTMALGKGLAPLKKQRTFLAMGLCGSSRLRDICRAILLAVFDLKMENGLFLEATVHTPGIEMTGKAAHEIGFY